jgi:fimbrial chaperone protein
MRTFPRLLGATVALALGLVGAAPASAGSFSANPVRLTLPAGSTSTSLLLENRGETPVVVQASTASWRQEAGRDVVEETEDLIVSPPIFTIPVGASQTVRVGLVRPAEPTREVTYRLFLQEVPSPVGAGESGVAVALQLALPLFVQPVAKASPRLAWRARSGDDGEVELSLANDGTTHVQVLDARLAGVDGTVFAEVSPRAYVLSGQSRSWRMKPLRPWTGEALRVTARTGSGDVTAQVTAIR